MDISLYKTITSIKKPSNLQNPCVKWMSAGRQAVSTGWAVHRLARSNDLFFYQSEEITN